MDDMARRGRYYLKCRNGVWQICWTENGAPQRRSTFIRDYDAACDALDAFASMHELGEPSADVERWRPVVRAMRNRQSSRAAKKGMAFDLSEDYLLGLLARCNFRCTVSGIPFTWSTEPRRMSKWAPSVDRIDSGHGYVQGNVRLVVLAANLAMNGWGYDCLLRLSQGVVAKHFRTTGQPELVGVTGIEPATTTMSR